MRLLINTNCYGDLVALQPDATARLQQAEEAWISSISLGELLGGFEFGTRTADNKSRLSAFLQLQGVGVVTIDENTPAIYGRVYAQLRRIGRAIPTNDIWIAALALQNNFVLDTRDAHFQHVSGLQLA